MFYEIKDSKVSLRIKAQPAASKNEFCEIYGDDAIKIRIKAPAVEGAANKELVKFLSKSFKVAKSDIIFKSGQQSKIKIIEFPLTEKFTEWIETNGYR
ncbi:MAG: YggU family protein [Epsilonproteobacteria bacterium 4484_20]|nr:MAG: YggU family protein [Epsilonproteobacteria bacterium 4484_20]